MSNSMFTKIFRKKTKTFKEQNIRPYTINISGNIGCGKSTLSKRLDKLDFVYLIKEPVKLLQNYKGKNILQEYYDGKIKPLVFQELVIKIMFEYTRSEYNKSLKNDKITCVVLDRSLHDTIHTFLRMIPMHHSLFNNTKKLLNKGTYFPIDKFLCLISNPYECYKRIHKRGRSEEKDIKLSYLNDYNNTFIEWIYGSDFMLEHMSEIIIDNCDITYTPRQVFSQVKSILLKL